MIISDEAGDAAVLHDLLRAHFPGIVLEHVPALKTGLEAESRQTAEKVLVIRRIAGSSPGFGAVLVAEGKKYYHTECLQPGMFGEEKTNRERRLMRLAVYKAISSYCADMIEKGNEKSDVLEPSPWGILTGVRPTKIVHRLLDQGFSGEEALFHLRRDFGLSSSRARLVINTAGNQRPYLLAKDEARRRVSVYAGIPFCPTRCHYCSFPSYSLGKWGHLLSGYLEALYREIRSTGELLEKAGLTVQTFYLGGGTPTVLTPEQLDGVLSAFEQNLPREEKCEITVEGGRPDTIDKEKLVVLKSHKVERISINPQTMHEPTLLSIGRQHTTGAVEESVRLARKAGIPAINMDLIIGLPGENREVLAGTLKRVLAWKPENITLHALAIKRAALYRQERLELRLPGHDEGRAMMEEAREMLEGAGYQPYYLYRQKEILAHGENVGYTLEGYPCLYNIQMMEERQTVLGFGVGAGSKIVNVRNWSVDNFYNPKDLLVYMARLEDLIKRKVDRLEAFVNENA
ncbi:MAG: coproporphyrinogen dehydrogenase HemZ [Peptococcaceae bacterium]|nr:coproporphyrinogen dehydrogenase HemZ [Peptococcaceae bacterium]MDH7525133.1 coproporphyrinogen dehydrogenase HemZ [Peptococcaceae bacterium]